MPFTLSLPSSLSASEWLLTNALGGFAMGSAAGIPDRRYHSWLTAATVPPLGRVVALHSCVEWLVTEHLDNGVVSLDRRDLSSFRFSAGSIHPRGHDFLTRFERVSGTVRWTYTLGHITITRELCVAHHENTAFVRYNAAGLAGKAWLEVRPFVPLRDFHTIIRERPGHACAITDDGHLVEASSPEARVNLSMDREDGVRSTFAADPKWWRNFDYTRDAARGQEHVEDLPSPGVFIIALANDKVVTFKATVATVGVESPKHEGHDHIAAVSQGQQPRVLLEAADQFVVRRVSHSAKPLTSIIAGYPWFSDWGRDTFISMRGLLLCTKRFEEALQVLTAFAALEQRGLIPNCFDNSGSAEYNTVDASLWFVHAACEYIRTSTDRAGFNAGVRQACLNVVDAYCAGTDFGIRMDSDGLITAGDASTQLTWMDARRDGVVFTPRHGKAVEINALWYSGLLELADAIEPELPRRAREFRQVAQKAGAAFSAFWNSADGCLFDVITPSQDGAVSDRRVRPNQLIAVSQPFSPLTPEQRSAVIAKVERSLLTPYGLRTLDPSDPGYRARYEGSLFERDRAYHNGTVWPWLIGPYCEAVLRAGQFSTASKARAAAAIRTLLQELESPSMVGPIGQLAEVYDGDVPHRPDGCPGQAWSVAEVLRVWTLING